MRLGGPLGFVVVVALACGGGGASDDGDASASISISASVGTTSGPSQDSEPATGTGSGPNTDATNTPVAGDLRFDVGPPDIVYDPEEESGCSKVDFLFVIDSSNSMATNQGELVASFPEFVMGIESTLTDVDSFHVGVVTSDAYAFNGAGCTQLGACVTQTGGVNSSMAVCDPFAAGFRYMTQDDDLPTAFACAALIGTAGDNNEQMMAGATEALSPALGAAGACNDGFIREDALLVTVLITDEDDPGSSLIGSPGDPMSWYDDFIAAKTFAENVVVLTLTRGAPGNICGGAVGSEVDGTRLMQFAQLFGPNGFLGDICAASFGPFFDQAIMVIEDACENFMPPEG